MPKTIRNRNTASKFRKGTDSRKNNPTEGRQGRITRESAPAVIANSVFALTLKQKGGAEVLISKSTENCSKKDIEAIYNDLYSSLNNAMQIFHGEPLVFNPRPALSIGTSTDYIIRVFKEKILPAGIDFKITENYGKYQFTMFKQCPSYDEWAVFEVCHVVRHLKKTYPRLLEIFIHFLKALHTRTGVDLWYGDTISYAATWLQDSIDERREEYQNGIIENNANGFGWDQSDEDHYLKMVNTEAEYRTGEPAAYERKINQAVYILPDKLLAILNRLKKKHPLIEFIRKGCRFLQAYKYSVHSFDHQELSEYYETGCGLSFLMQHSVMWDVNDDYTERHCEYIDCEWQEGVIPPILALSFTESTTASDLTWFDNGDDYPTALSDFFSYAAKTFKKYEPKHRRNNR